MIVHGDNQIKSRDYFLGLKAQAKTAGRGITEIDGSSVNYSDFLTSVSAVSLFSDQNEIFVEHLFTRRPSSDKKNIIKYLLLHPSDLIHYWDSRDISAEIKDFPSSQKTIFNLPKYIFDFLDTLDTVSYRKTLEVSAPEQIFFLLTAKIHDLILLRLHHLNSPTWKIQKLQACSNHLSLANLLSLYRDLLTLDYRQKTSSSVLDLSASLDLWINKFQLSNKKV